MRRSVHDKKYFAYEPALRLQLAKSVENVELSTRARTGHLMLKSTMQGTPTSYLKEVWKIVDLLKITMLEKGQKADPS